MRRSLAALALAAALGGCAGGPAAPTVLHRGEIAPGRFLATLVVADNGCYPHGTACAVQDSERGIMFLPADVFTPPHVYEQLAVELCHAVAGVRGVPDGQRICAGRSGDTRVSQR